MIDLKRCNYITGQTSAVSFGLSKIMSFFEDSGKTPIFIYKKESTFQHLIHTSRTEFKNLQDFEDLIDKKSTLFRVDLVVVDLWFCRNVSEVLSYKDILQKLNLDFVIITNKYHYIQGDQDVNIYKIESESSDSINWKLDTKYWVSDLLTNSKTTMDDLVIAFRRDKKIDDIIDRNNC